MNTTYTTWDITNNITTREDALTYLQAAFDEAGDDPAFIQHILGQIARALGMTNLAKELGLSRPSLYRALSEDGNPSFQTISHLITALGGQLTITTSHEQAA